MMPIIKWTLWQRRWSAFWWSLGVSAFIFINMIFYTSFRDQAAELQKSFESLPDKAVQLAGGSTDFFSAIGFLNSQIFFLSLPLLLGILAIGLGSSLLAREEQDRTIESLLAHPISRLRILLGKSIAGALILAIVSVVAFIITLVTARLVDLNLSSSSIAATTLICFLMSLSFGALALMITALGRARSASLGITVLVAFGGYIISSLAGTVGWLKVPSKVLPFHYYQSESILRGFYNWENTLFFVGLIGLCSIIAAVIFRRRDIY
jgi:ABC-2 type transport system permease protein